MDRETTKVAKNFVKRIRKVIDIKRIILFGSRARGDHFKKSDFDFIIVSDDFKGIHFFQRIPKMYDYWNEDYELEAICYTQEEFERKKKEFGIVRKAVKEGIEL